MGVLRNESYLKVPYSPRTKVTSSYPAPTFLKKLIQVLSLFQCKVVLNELEDSGEPKGKESVFSFEQAVNQGQMKC